MNSPKSKFYLLISGIALIVLVPIIYNIVGHLKSNKLNADGIKTEAIIKDLTRSRNIRTRTFYYSISLSYKDGNGTSYLETIEIDYENYHDKAIGQNIDM